MSYLYKNLIIRVLHSLSFALSTYAFSNPCDSFTESSSFEKTHVTTRFCDSLKLLSSNNWFKILQVTHVKPRARWQKLETKTSQLNIYCDEHHGTLFTERNLGEIDQHRGVGSCSAGKYSIGVDLFLDTEEEYCFTKRFHGVYFKKCEINNLRIPPVPLLKRNPDSIDNFDNTKIQVLSLHGKSQRLFINTGRTKRSFSLPIKQNLITTTAFNNKLFACAGNNENIFSFKPYRMCWIFDPKLMKWQNSVGVTFGRYNARMVQLTDNSVIITGGQMNWLKTSKSTEIYEVENKIWKKGPLMVYPRYGHCVVNFKGSIYVFGGSKIKNSVHLVVPFIEKLDLSQSPYKFKVIGSLPEASTVYFHACHVFKNDIYISGGIKNLKNGQQVTKFVHTNQVLKSSDGKNFEFINGLNLNRSKHSMFTKNGFLAVLGGGNGAHDSKIKNFNNMEIYNEVDDKWLTKRVDGIPVMTNLETVNLL